MGPAVSLTPLGGGLFLGWALGSNDAANCFGTAVATHIVSFRNACLICGAMVILGAMFGGEAGIKTLSGMTDQTIPTAIIVTVAAGLTGTAMTFAGLPISTSQAIVGAILGIGLATKQTDYGILVKVVLCWIGTPIGAMLIACIVYKIGGWLIMRIPMSMFTRDKILWAGLLLAGAYGSYALGANNVANSTGIFSGLIPGVGNELLATIGGFAIAAGVLTYSRRVMFSVGSSILPLDAFTALVAVLSMSITVHVFAFVGAPVSTSQGIVGSILGIGMLRGAQGIHFKVLRRIAFGWVLTPAIALVLAAAGYAIFL